MNNTATATATATVYKHPPWRRLYQEFADLVEKKGADNITRLFTYAELETMSGVDVRTKYGRRQLYRFNAECRTRLHIHLENVRNEGYRVIRPSEHVGYGVVRIDRAHRQLVNGKIIVDAADVQRMTTPQAQANLLASASIGTVINEMERKAVPIQRISGVMDQPKQLKRQYEIGNSFVDSITRKH